MSIEKKPLEEKSALTAENTKSVEGLTPEEKALDLELKRLELAERKAAAKDREDKKEQKRIQAESRNNATLAQMAQTKAREEHCTHRKGGLGAGAVLDGQGDAAEYAVIKHKLPIGKYFILCTRCLKEWHPADPVTGTPETPGYKEALMFPTKNAASGSSTFTFVDNRTGHVLNKPDNRVVAVREGSI